MTTHDRCADNLAAGSIPILTRRALALAVLCACAAVASSQYLEHTTDLSGPQGSVRWLDCVAVNPSNHTVYVGGDSWVAVLDGASPSYAERIPVGHRCQALCYVPQENELFAACEGTPDSTVYVFDCGSNRVRAKVRVGVRPQSLCYDPDDHKVYCGNWTSNSVSAIDAIGDTLLATIPAGVEPTTLCYNPVEHKVYCANYHSASVTVIDATADTVVATVTVGRCPVSLCCNPQNDKVYCGAKDGGKLMIIDGAGDTVRAALSLAGEQVGLCFNPLADRVYLANGDMLAVIDGKGDSTIIGWLLQGFCPVSVLYNPVNHKVYAASNLGQMAVLDGATDSLLAEFVLPDDSRRMAVDTTLNRVFGAYMNTPSVAYVDGAGDSLLAAVRIGVKPFELCYNPVEDKVYTVNRDNCGTVSVIDAATDSLLSTIPLVGYPWDIRCDSALNKVFVSVRGGHGTDSAIAVIDCSTDTVETTVSASSDPYYLCYYPQRGKLYCDDGSALDVLDAATNSMLTRIPLPSYMPGRMAHNPTFDKVYVADDLGSVLTVVDGTGDSVRTAVRVQANGFYVHYDRKDEKLYAMSPSMLNPFVFVISGRNDSIIKIIDSIMVCGACQNPSKSQVFMLGFGEVVVVDGQGDSILARISIPGNTAMDIEYDVAHDKAYCSDGLENSVTVIDALTHHVIRSIPVGRDPVDMVWVPRHNRMFVANANGSSVSVVRDTTMGIAEQGQPTVGSSHPNSTVVHGVLFLSEASGLKPQPAGWLLDISGRKVLELKPGANDVRALAPGVYFVREEPQAASHKLQVVRKIVVTR